MGSFFLVRLVVHIVLDLKASSAKGTLSHYPLGAALKQVHGAPVLSTHATSLSARLRQGRQSTTNFAAINPFGKEKPAMGRNTTDARAKDLVSALGCGAVQVAAATAAARSSHLKEEIVEKT